MLKRNQDAATARDNVPANESELRQSPRHRFRFAPRMTIIVAVHLPRLPIAASGLRMRAKEHRRTISDRHDFRRPLAARRINQDRESNIKQNKSKRGHPPFERGHPCLLGGDIC